MSNAEGSMLNAERLTLNAERLMQYFPVPDITHLAFRVKH